MEGIVTIKEIEVDGLTVNLALVDIASLKANDPENVLPLLTAGEKVSYHAFKIDKRRYEWLAGRLGVKLLVCDVYGVEPNEVDVQPNWTRKPFARVNGEFIDACISITHSGDLAVCGLVKGGKLGLDVEHVEERNPGMLEEAFSDNERKALGPGLIDWWEVTHHWTRKEAVAKALGIGLGLSLHDIKAVGEAEVGLSEKSSWRLCLDPNKRFNTHRVTLDQKWDDDYILNMCVLEDTTSIYGLVDTPECVSSPIGEGGLIDE